MNDRATSRGAVLTAIGSIIVGTAATMKILVPSLDLLSGMHLFTDQIIFVGLFFFILGLLLSKRVFMPPAALLLFFAFALYEMCRGFFSVTAPSATRGMEMFACISVMLIASFYASQGPRGMKLVLGILAGIGATVAVVAAGQFFVSLPELRANPDLYINSVAEIDRAEFLDRLLTNEAFGPFTISNALAAFALLIMFTFTLTSLANRFSRKEIAGIAIALIGAFVLIISMSKGGFLAAGFGIAASAFFISRLRGASIVKSLVLPAILIFAGGIGLIALVAYGHEGAGRASAHVRLQYWQATSRIIAESPIIGTGSGTFRDVYYTYKAPDAGETRHAHCDYLEIAAEDGVLGLLLFLAALTFLFAGRRAVDGDENADDRPGRSSFITAGIVWLGLLAAIIFSGAADYDNILAHASGGSPVWVLLLVLTLFAGPVAAYFTALHVQVDSRTTSWIRAGAAVGLIAFLVHSTIDFNFYNEGASLAFFGVAGILAATRHGRGSRILLGAILVLALLFSFVASELSRGRDAISTIEGYSYAIRSGESRLDSTATSELADSLAVLPPRLLDDSESYAARGELCELLAISRPPFNELAEKHYRTAILLNPHRFSYYRSLGSILLKTEFTEESLKVVGQACRLYPGNADLLAQYITTLLDAGRLEESRAEYAKLAKLLAYKLPVRAMAEKDVIERIKLRIKR